jgi:spore coat protein CotH
MFQLEMKTNIFIPTMHSKLHTLNILLAVVITLVSCNDGVDLHEIDIIKQGEFSWEQKEECSIIYTYDGQSVDIPATIKYRGGHSARYEKHSFSLELVTKYQLAGLPKDDDWILNANYIDKTFMRHKISYDLYRDMNEKNIAAASDYVNVSINSEPQGLYLITEEVNGGQVNLNKKDSLAMIFKDPPFLFESRIGNPQDSSNYYQQKFPKIHKSDQTVYIEAFRSVIFDTSDAVFDSEIGSWIDIENVIDWHLLLLYSYNADGIMKNFYLYKLDTHTPFRIAIWDYDHSFGRDGDNEMNMMDRSMRIERSKLFNRLLASESLDYMDKLKRRWAQLRSSGLFSENYMKSRVSKIDKKIYKSVQRNAEIWPLNSKWYYDENTYEEEKILFLKFVKMRLEVLDEEFDYRK